MSVLEKPRWLRDLLRFLPLKPQFVLSGNVRDLQLSAISDSVVALSLPQILAAELRAAGYSQAIVFDPVAGLHVVGVPGETPNSTVLNELGLEPANGAAPAGIDRLSEVLDRLVTRNGDPIALIVDLASRLIIRNEVLSSHEHQLFTRASRLSHHARPRPYGAEKSPFFNTVIWISDKEGDLPDWFVVNNSRVRHIPLAKPDAQIRKSFAPSLLRGLSGFREASEQARQEAVRSFVDHTEGLLLVDMIAIAQLSRSEDLNFSSVGDAVRRYKVGVSEDPWLRIDRDKIKNADAYVRSRVKGQEHAITHMLDIVKRAVTGVGAPRRGGRPRGVAFLAGPTGVGKTEMAKTITSLLFGDDSAYVRFDMSEFSAEHSDQRLIGAPPGYVGYDVGGELTNAVREKPFCLALFDEIEKAHPRILDKFLQILDDGVLTSGRGDRVYFSESFIVFTSNLGIYKQERDGSRVLNVSAKESLPEVQAKVRSEIEKYFKEVLNRPEILNRIGDNIVVFDFIRPTIAAEIFAQMIVGVLEGVRREQGIEVEMSAGAQETLAQACLIDLSNGGRGIRNKVESHLINPLARALFDTNAKPGMKVEVSEIAIGSTSVLQIREVRKAHAVG